MKKQLTRMLSLAVMAALLLSMALGVSAAEALQPVNSDDLMNRKATSDSIANAGESVTDFSAADNAGVFALKISSGTEVVVIGAFLVKEGSNTYLLTHGLAAAYAQEGYALTLMAPDGTNMEAVCVGYDENAGIAYLYANGTEFYNPLALSRDPFTTTVVSGLAFTDDNATVCRRIEYKAFDFSEWTQLTEHLYALQDVEMAMQWYGCPIFHDTRNYNVQGIGTAVTDGNDNIYIAILNFSEIYLEPSVSLAAIASGSGQPSGTQPSGSQPTASQPAGTSSGEPADTGIDTKYLILGGIAVAAVVYYFYSKNKKAEESRQEEASAAPAVATMPLDATLPLEPEATHAKTRAITGWQLRSLGGVLGDNTFPIGGVTTIGRSTKCDIRFPDGTAGISGSHCQISLEGDRVILRDLGSSYGTFVGGTRLAPNEDRALFAGDTFVLAQNGPSFRLENVGGGSGGMGSTSGPAVRSIDGKVYRAGASGRLTFGRKSDCVVKFPDSDKSVSSSHCELYREGGKLYLMDTGSTNGTFFNANERLKPNKPYRVRKGMAFFLADQKNTFVVTED